MPHNSKYARLVRATGWLTAACVIALMAGCETPVRLMPTPVTFQSGDVDPFAKAGAKLHGTEVPVFYATNRGAVIEKPEPIHTILPSERLRMGIAHVRIGDETLSWDALHRLSTSADPDERPIVHLESLEQMVSLGPNDKVSDSKDAQAFFALVNRTLADSQSHDLLVYVHGSNNTVPRSAAQAAQLRHFTGRRMVVLSFQWPSAGSALKYLTDVGNARASVEPFVRLIKLLATYTDASAIDVLAYSAGAQIVSPGLVELAKGTPGETRAQVRQHLRLKHIYYAAPDIDTRRFVDELSKYVDVVDRVTVAANLSDSALRVAGMIHRGSRAGRPDPSELNAEQTAFMVRASQQYGFDLLRVDPNDIPDLPASSHAFWYEDPWVSGDLLGLLLLDATPPRRGLDGQSTGGGARYWTFPPDFSERVTKLFSPRARAAPAQPAGAAAAPVSGAASAPMH